MRVPRLILAGSVFAVVAMYATPDCHAQRFLQSLPQDGTRAVYLGTYRVTKPNPESPSETVVTEWLQQITIASVGAQTVDSQPCRWIEFAVRRGRSANGGVNLGKAGVLIYKCLIPENAIGNQTSDFIPIIRGWRKVADGEPTPIQGKVLRLSPMITLLDYYPDQTEQESESIALQNHGNVQCRVLSGSRAYSGRSGRTKCAGRLWLNDSLPFGIAKWQATQSREELLGSEEGDQFRFAGEVTTEMALLNQENAASELPDNN